MPLSMDYAALKDIPVGLCVLKNDKKDLTCLYANTAMQTLLGINLVGRPLLDIWPSLETKELAKELRGLVPPIEAVLPIDRNVHKSWALLSIQESYYEGEPAFTLWATDISASKEAEETMRLAAQAAGSAAEQKSNFLATISHEIRTPMQSVYGLLEMIELENPTPNVMSMHKQHGRRPAVFSKFSMMFWISPRWMRTKWNSTISKCRSALWYAVF